MVLSCQNITKSFSEKCILKNASFHIEDNEKAAIVGVNGAGKSTLLKIIIGELEPDNGTAVFSKNASFGYLAQHQNIDTQNTIYQELLEVKMDLILLEKNIRELELQIQELSASSPEKLQAAMDAYASATHEYEMQGGYQYKSELNGVLKGLGFLDEDFHKSISTLSGGQKTRVALGKLLLTKPDLIILDEPTNHLDMSSISWLETYLLNYKGAVLIVSHDRYFLDKITSKIIEIDQTEVTVFSGNYSDYAGKKEQLRAAKMAAYINQKREIKHQEEVIEKLKSFNREKFVKRAESREKLLNKIERVDKPSEAETDMRFVLSPKITSGNDVLHVSGLSKSFDDFLLFSGLSFDIKRGEHVAIIGNNGTGKTTILKIVNDVLPADSGIVELGSKVQIGYYDQEHHVLHDEKTLFEEISDDYPTLTNTEIRNTLAAFLFTGEDVFKRVGDLSGGEKGRVSLAKLMLSEANFLILDEPTNHLDITSKEILETAIRHYPGTVLYVSHDRYFINRTATRILDLTDNGDSDTASFLKGNRGSLTLNNYIGNYDYYLEKKADVEAASKDDGHLPKERSASSNAPAGASSEKSDWRAYKEQQANQRKLENAFQKTELRIEELEDRNKAIEQEMMQPEVATNVARLQKLSDEQASISEELEHLYEKWDELSEAVSSR